jgi:hypothetical protein
MHIEKGMGETTGKTQNPTNLLSQSVFQQGINGII